jgi:flagellar biosynthesis/type III secretory pathway M-ring protein FliF/YscJ
MLPTVEVWAQYPLIAVIVLVIVLLGAGARKFWLEFTAWQDKQAAKLTEEQERQDLRRREERETQRIWEADQNRMREEAQDKRERSWQAVIQQLENRQSENAEQTNKLLGDLVENLNCISRDLRSHDAFARSAIEAMIPDPGINSGASAAKQGRVKKAM